MSINNIDCLNNSVVSHKLHEYGINALELGQMSSVCRAWRNAAKGSAVWHALNEGFSLKTIKLMVDCGYIVDSNSLDLALCEKLPDETIVFLADHCKKDKGIKDIIDRAISWRHSENLIHALLERGFRANFDAFHRITSPHYGYGLDFQQKLFYAFDSLELAKADKENIYQLFHSCVTRMSPNVLEKMLLYVPYLKSFDISVALEENFPSNLVLQMLDKLDSCKEESEYMLRRAVYGDYPLDVFHKILEKGQPSEDVIVDAMNYKRSSAIVEALVENLHNLQYDYVISVAKKNGYPKSTIAKITARCCDAPRVTCPVI